MKAIRKYENHPNILKVKEAINALEHFTFRPTNLEYVFKKIHALNGSKASSMDSIPVKIMLKENEDILGLKIVRF